MSGRTGNTLFRLRAENDQINVPQVCEIQNASGRVAAFDEVFRLAPCFSFGRNKLAQQLFRGFLDIEPRDKITWFWFRHNMQECEPSLKLLCERNGVSHSSWRFGSKIGRKENLPDVGL